MADGKKIFIVEDENRIARFLQMELEHEGFETETESNGSRAYERIIQGDFDLVLLDVMLPDMDGLTICKKVRELSDVPIIMLTARDDVNDKVQGLDIGADDYVTKPFSGQVLVSRINALLRRSGGFANDMPDGLTASEQRLYSYFTLNKGRVLTRDQLLAHMWDSKGEYVSDNTLSVAVNRIRSKLAGHGRIVTVKGVGYKWGDL